MAGAIRFTTSSRINPPSSDSGKTGQVLRPGISRWLPEWINTFRQNGDNDAEVIPEAGVVHMLSGTAADKAVRIRELQQKAAEAMAACDEWTDRSQCFETNLDRAREQREQSAERLAIAGESIPDENTEQVSMLQESYRNFTMAFELHRQKLEHAQQKVAGFQEKQACICAEMLALSEDPRDQKLSTDNGSFDDPVVDDLQRAA